MYRVWIFVALFSFAIACEKGSDDVPSEAPAPEPTQSFSGELVSVNGSGFATDRVIRQVYAGGASA